MTENPASLELLIGPYRFAGRYNLGAAPNGCSALDALLPIELKACQARWSGEAAWAPLGRQLRLPPEAATSYPAVGQILLYAGPLSESEILIPYGPTAFASKAGPLAGSPIITLTEGTGQLEALGRLIVERGAQTFRLERRHSA